MKKKIHHIIYSAIGVILTALVYFLFAVIQDKIAYKRESDMLKKDNKEKTARIVKQNKVIDRHFNEFNELIEDVTECITTREIIEQRLSNEAREANFIINEYESVLDSIVTRDIIEVENLPRLNPVTF